MLKYLFLLLMLCSPALASLSGSEDDVDVDVDPWDKLSANKPESALRRSSTSARNLCDSAEKSAESSEPNKFIPDHKNLTIYHDRIRYVYRDRIEIAIKKLYKREGLGEIFSIFCSMKIDGKVIFAKIISMTDVSKDNSLSNHFNVYQVAAAESEFKEQAILRIPKLINDSRNQASLTFERNEKEIRFPLRLEHFIHDTSKENQSNPECVTYKKPSNEQ